MNKKIIAAFSIFLVLSFFSGALSYLLLPEFIFTIPTEIITSSFLLLSFLAILNHIYSEKKQSYLNSLVFFGLGIFFMVPARYLIEYYIRTDNSFASSYGIKISWSAMLLLSLVLIALVVYCKYGKAQHR